MEPLNPSPSSAPRVARTAAGPRSTTVLQPQPSPAAETPPPQRATLLDASPGHEGSSTSLHGGPASPSLAPRRRLRSIVVRSIQLPIDGQPPPAVPAGPRKVSFALNPTSPAHQPPVAHHCSARKPSTLKSCLKSSATLSATNADAPSQGYDDKSRSHGIVRDEDGRCRSLPKRWWRRADFAHLVDSKRPATRTSPPRPTITALLHGKCLRCLAGGHLAANCREPVKCFRCRRIGHRSWECRSQAPKRQASREEPALPRPRPPPLDAANFPALPLPARALPGDPSLRPAETSAVVASNRAMDAELARLSSCAVVACLCRDRDDINPGCIKKAVCSKLGVRENDVKVVRHRPEDFLIDFKFPHHRDAAVALKRLPIGTLNIRIKPWRILPYGNHCDLPYHVRLCLEGIPVHAWNKSIAKRAIARDCNLDYVDPSSLRRDDTRALCLWAWTYSPSDIPKTDS